MPTRVDRFWEWFDAQRNGMPIREVERRGSAPHGRISNVYRKKEPSAMVCETIAKALGIPEEEVFRRAGLLPAVPAQPEPTSDEMIRKIYQMMVDGRLGLHRMSEPKTSYLADEGDLTLRELIQIAKALSKEERELLMQMARALRQRGESGGGDAGEDRPASGSE